MSKKEVLIITAFIVPWVGGVISTWISISPLGVMAVIALAWLSFIISNWAWGASNV